MVMPFLPRFLRLCRLTGFALFCTLSFLAGWPRTAEASCTNCACVLAADASLTAWIFEQHFETRLHVSDAFEEHRRWMVDTDHPWRESFFNGHVGRAMMMLTEQLSAVGMQQMMIVGAFLDAKHQLETQRLFQQLAAEAHKDYYPSEGLCLMGSVAKSLSAANRNADVTYLLMGERSIDRQLGNVNSNASEGPKEDLQGRVEQFRTTYCDPLDNNAGLGDVCTGSPAARRNKDVSYVRTIGSPLTLDVNFGDAALTPDEQDVLALASNLYSHDVFSRHSAAVMSTPANQALYLKLRSIVAKRSVAEQSFNAITAMKASGHAAGAEGGETVQYMRALLQEFGVPAADIEGIIGANPSYYAQMEILTKKIYQRPEFYLELYDKPANVARKGVAIEALNLMQDRDIYNSKLRSEAILSVILELGLMQEQEKLQNNRNSLRPEVK